MPNVADTDAYSTFDHVFSKTVRTLSKVIGLRRITQPFWARWRASGVGEDIIFRFLDEIGTIDNWASTAITVLENEIHRFEMQRKTLNREEQISALRQLSYLGHMGQWGCLPINDYRKGLYRKARDYYIEAESLAFGPNYKRLTIPWRDTSLPGNLHTHNASRPLIAIIHGIDGCKEEHLATELALYESGFDVLCFDGPGQGESLLISNIFWEADFFQAISAAIDAVATQGGTDGQRVGLLGISIGGMWALQCAASDNRIRALFDLGGPIHTRRFPTLPFLIKTRLCQITGAHDDMAIKQVLDQNNIESKERLKSVHCHIRMVHGERDRVVSTADKRWLHEVLTQFANEQGRADEISLRVIADGDHCCTGQFDIVRQDAIEFFIRSLAIAA